MDADILLRVGKRHKFFVATKRTARRMAEILGLQRLHDYILNNASFSGAPVWLLGVCFKNGYDQIENVLEDKVLAALTDRFQTMMYFSYRYNFPSDGLGDWTSDIGWGCTIRSGQMMMAQALLEHLKETNIPQEDSRRLPPSKAAAVASLFWDSPQSDHIFSIHHVCQKAAKYGVAPGSWMGPGFVCRLLYEICEAKHPFGLHTALICHPDGAPFLTPSKIDDLENVFALKSNTDQETITSGSSSTTLYYQKGETALILLIPLVLGMSQIDDRYLKQLKQILTWPQSIGFIGGRSNSSLYFVGFQEDHLLYLDPHKSQKTDSKPTDLTTHWNAPLKLMHISGLITSLSIGFYCKTIHEFQDLISKLKELEKSSNGAPILSFLEDGIVHDVESDQDNLSKKGSVNGENKSGSEDWEIL